MKIEDTPREVYKNQVMVINLVKRLLSEYLYATIVEKQRTEEDGLGVYPIDITGEDDQFEVKLNLDRRVIQKRHTRATEETYVVNMVIFEKGNTSESYSVALSVPRNPNEYPEVLYINKVGDHFLFDNPSGLNIVVNHTVVEANVTLDGETQRRTGVFCFSEDYMRYELNVYNPVTGEFVDFVPFRAEDTFTDLRIIGFGHNFFV